MACRGSAPRASNLCYVRRGEDNRPFVVLLHAAWQPARIGDTKPLDRHQPEGPINKAFTHRLSQLLELYQKRSSRGERVSVDFALPALAQLMSGDVDT